MMRAFKAYDTGAGMVVRRWTFRCARMAVVQLQLDITGSCSLSCEQTLPLGQWLSPISSVTQEFS
jgi:hypothetical protein